MSLPRTTDFLVVGAGIVGVQIARVLRTRFPSAAVTVIDKEATPGVHASARNSGVLHAGFYYAADSLKARFCREGNAWMTRYCKDRKLRLNKCGKVVVAQTERHIEGIHTLLQRAAANGVHVERITPRELSELEPLARTHDVALWSPTTSSADPAEVMAALVDDARAEGIQLACGTAFVAQSGADRRGAGVVVQTSRGAINAAHVVNSAGLYADKVALSFGVGAHYHLLPFRGVYLLLSNPISGGMHAPPPPPAHGRTPAGSLAASLGAGCLRRHVYPVPDLDAPFLGVHFTVTVDGKAKIGPTAMPAFWREQYTGLQGCKPSEVADILRDQLHLFATNAFNFRSLAAEELRKYHLPSLLASARQLVPSMAASSVRRYGKAGIRAQLVDTRSWSLVMDFVVEAGPSSTHVLNAVSPGWTCSRPFAEHVVDTYVLPAVSGRA